MSVDEMTDEISVFHRCQYCRSFSSIGVCPVCMMSAHKMTRHTMKTNTNFDCNQPQTHMRECTVTFTILYTDNEKCRSKTLEASKMKRNSERNSQKKIKK